MDSGGGGETMHRQGRWKHAVAVLATVGALAACGDDDPAGPEFRDLAFAPADTVVIGSGRETSLTLSNAGTIELGPILLGSSPAVGKPPLEDVLCAAFQTTIVPSRITSLSPGAAMQLEISIDDSNVDVILCPTGVYEIQVLASVSDLNLATVTVRIDWDGQN